MVQTYVFFQSEYSNVILEQSWQLYQVAKQNRS